jgi:hypothetical protein
MLNRKCTFLENTLCLKEHCKTGSVPQFVCTVIPSNYLELIQYENPNSTLKQNKDTNLYSCSCKNICEKFIWSTISRYHNGFTIYVRLYRFENLQILHRRLNWDAKSANFQICTTLHQTNKSVYPFMITTLPPPHPSQIYICLINQSINQSINFISDTSMVKHAYIILYNFMLFVLYFVFVFLLCLLFFIFQRIYL